MKNKPSKSQQTKPKQRELNLILGTRRCGTSLIAAILHECNANFGPVQLTPEHKRAGYMEDPLVGKSESYFRKYYDVRKTWPFMPVFLINWLRKEGIRTFNYAIHDKRDWVKNGALISCLADLSKSLKFKPKVLGIIRHPVENIASFSNSKGTFGMEADVTKMYERYYNTNMKLLLHLENYGGCLVSFHDIMDRKKTNWADAIVRAFPQFKKKDLIKARNKLVDKRVRNAGKQDIIYLPGQYKKFWAFLQKKVKQSAKQSKRK